jgi:hypothetical protein
MNKFIEKLHESLETATQDMDLFMQGILAAVIANAPSILEQYESLGIALDDAITNPWGKATEAIIKYGGVDGLGVMNSWINEGGIFPTFKEDATTALTSPWEAGKTALGSFKQSVDIEMKNIVKTIESNVSSAKNKLGDLTSKIQDTSKKTSTTSSSSSSSSSSKTSSGSSYYSGGSGYNNGSLSTEEIKKMQKALGVTVDGKWGPNSQAAAMKKWKVTSADDAYKKFLDNSKGGNKNNNPTTPTTPTKPSFKENTNFNIGLSIGQKDYKKTSEIQGSDGNFYYPYTSIIGNFGYIKKGEGYTITKDKNHIDVHSFKPMYIKMHAKGTLGTKQDEWAITDESWIGEEITLAAGKNGQLQYLKKGSAVMPADISANLVEWGKLNPNMMNIANPSAGINLMTNYVSKPELNLSFDALVKAESITQETLPAVKELVKQEFDRFTKQLNYSIKRVGAN